MVGRTTAELFALFPEPAVRTKATQEADVGDAEPIFWEDLEPYPPASIEELITAEQIPGQRSEACMHCASAMLSAGYTREQVLGVMLCQENPIAAHVFDQPNPDRAARRIASRATKPQSPEEIFETYGIEPPAERAGEPLIDIDQAPAYFKGCVYIVPESSVFLPDGEIVGREQFDAVMGGKTFRYRNGGESGGGPETTLSAWQAFLFNHRWEAPKAKGTCFRPEEKPGEVVMVSGKPLVNAYMPYVPPRRKGDPNKWVNHLKLLWPHGDDFDILNSYIARCIQSPGIKAQWWPVLQGAQGIGKTLIGRAIAFSIGNHFVHAANGVSLAKDGIKFNGWFRHKLFMIVDEAIFNATFFEQFKPYVTNPMIAIEAKRVEEVMCDNRCNGIIFTNHGDAVPIGPDERRYAPFFSPIQSYTDLLSAGMDGPYFDRMYDWLDRGHGWEIINDWYRSYPVNPRYDPAGQASYAPRTSSSDAAVEENRSDVSNYILEAVDRQDPGFRCGWLSTVHLSRLLKTRGIEPHPRLIGRYAREAGYVPHPAMHGRLTKSSFTVDPMSEATRTRLYYRPGGMIPSELSTDACERLFKATNL